MPKTIWNCQSGWKHQMMWIKIPTVSLLLHYLCRQLFGCVSQTNRKTRVSCGARIHFLLLQSFWRLLFYLATHKNVFQVFNVCIVFELQTFVTQRINSRVSIYLLLWKPESSTLYFNIKEPDFLVFLLKCSWAIILQVFWRLFSLDIGCFFNKFCHVISVVENCVRTQRQSVVNYTASVQTLTSYGLYASNIPNYQSLLAPQQHRGQFESCRK